MKRVVSAAQRDQIVNTVKALMILHGIRSPQSFKKYALIARQELVAEETARMGAAVSRIGR